MTSAGDLGGTRLWLAHPNRHGPCLVLRGPIVPVDRVRLPTPNCVPHALLKRMRQLVSQ